jgi:hypothetical protein
VCQLLLHLVRKSRLQPALSHGTGGESDKVRALVMVVIGVHTVNIHLRLE